MSDENDLPQLRQKRPGDESALTPPPRKKAGASDPWKLKGRHIGRSIHAFANFTQLVINGIQLDKDLALSPDDQLEKYPQNVRLQYKLYTQILRCLPTFEDGLTKETISSSQLNKICASIQAGANAARSDDIKGLKAAVVDWISDGVSGLSPPIPRNQMSGRGFLHPVTGKLLCPAGLDWNDPRTKKALEEGKMTVNSDQWPILLYLNEAYDPDYPWDGLLRGRLVVNAFKHIFTSPSSVDNTGRSTKSSNAAIHGMTSVTPASIVYAATLVRFALGTRNTMGRNDMMIDSQNFYNVLLGVLEHPAERENVNALIDWWNKQVFPNHVASYRAPTANSPLAKLLQNRDRRAALQTINTNAA